MFRGEIPVGGEVLRIERFFVRVRVSGDVSSELQTCSIQRGLRRSEYLRIERFFVCSEERFLSVVSSVDFRLSLQRRLTHRSVKISVMCFARLGDAPCFGLPCGELRLRDATAFPECDFCASRLKFRRNLVWGGGVVTEITRLRASASPRRSCI
jgi:hypothetical protein